MWGGNLSPLSLSPLLYGLLIEELFQILHNYTYESRDYQVTSGSPWNYALYLPNDEDYFVVTKQGLQKDLPPFSGTGAPILISAKVQYNKKGKNI